MILFVGPPAPVPMNHGALGFGLNRVEAPSYHISGERVGPVTGERVDIAMTA